MDLNVETARMIALLGGEDKLTEVLDAFWELYGQLGRFFANHGLEDGPALTNARRDGLERVLHDLASSAEGCQLYRDRPSRRLVLRVGNFALSAGTTASRRGKLPWANYRRPTRLEPEFWGEPIQDCTIYGRLLLLNDPPNGREMRMSPRDVILRLHDARLEPIAPDYSHAGRKRAAAEARMSRVETEKMPAPVKTPLRRRSAAETA
jgi:hypothetical protein